MRFAPSAALALRAGRGSAQLNLLSLAGGVPGFPVSTVKIDPDLSSVLQSAGFDQPIEAVLTFDHYPTATDLLALPAGGVQVRPLRALNAAGPQRKQIGCEIGRGHVRTPVTVKSRIPSSPSKKKKL